MSFKIVHLGFPCEVRIILYIHGIMVQPYVKLSITESVYNKTFLKMTNPHMDAITRETRIPIRYLAVVASVCGLLKNKRRNTHPHKILLIL